MRSRWRALCALAGTAVAVAMAAEAGAATYSAQVRWQRNTDPSIAGYRVYQRTAGGTYGAPQDVGVPAEGPDGTFQVVRTGLDLRTDYVIAVSAYSAAGESQRSNEVAIGYVQAAQVIDSDGDGLTDALEDTNLNRTVDAGENDPNDSDTDNDAVADGLDACRGTASGAAVSATGCSCAQITCNDGNACNGVETCSAGVCTPGTPTCNDNNPCTTDSCNPTGGCVYTPNTNSCTDDGNACTRDVCASGACTHPGRSNGTSCNDGRFCTIQDTCQAGVCTGGGPNCTNLDSACRRGACDDDRDVCVGARRPDGTPCDNGIACDGSESCQQGSCVSSGALSCDDNNVCTTDGCDASGCTHVPADGLPCADGTFCNGSETCQGGACSTGEPPSCDDGNACTTDACDDSQGRCTHRSSDVGGCCTSDDQCADADACTTSERCVGGNCVSDPVTCPAGSQCTQSLCDPVEGCGLESLADGTRCEDGDPCTLGERCFAGTCRSARATMAEDSTVTFVVTRFSLKPAGPDNLRLVAKGSFPAAGLVDPRETGITVEINDGGGAARYTGTVPGEFFGANAVLTRWTYVATPGASQFDGLQRLVLAQRGDQIRLLAKGTVPRSVKDAATLTPAARSSISPEVGTSIGNLAFTIRFGNRCISDPVRCRFWGRRSRCS